MYLMYVKSVGPTSAAVVGYTSSQSGSETEGLIGWMDGWNRLSFPRLRQSRKKLLNY